MDMVLMGILSLILLSKSCLKIFNIFYLDLNASLNNSIKIYYWVQLKTHTKKHQMILILVVKIKN